MSKATKNTSEESLAPEAAPNPADQEGSALPQAGEPTPALSPEEIDALKAKAELAAQHWDRLLRVGADFDNFKKRVARERQDATKFRNESLLLKLIPVLDNFEAALTAVAAADAAGLQGLRDGITMIHQQLRNALTEGGLEEIDSTGKTFDPNLHEAVSTEECPQTPEGQVLRQIRKGYKLHERLLRPATVVVARKPAA